MRSTLEEFATELGDLRAFLNSITPVNTALAGHQDSLVRQYLTIRRRFDYAAFVVALYAAFETFVEDLVSSYAQLIAIRTSYASLPKSLINKHMYRSAEILLKGRYGEGRYAGISELDVVKNLFDCVSGTEQYSLNTAAVTAHDLNLRQTEMNKLFSSVGIENISDQARRLEPMLKWFCKLNSLSEAPADGVPAATIEQRIEGMVDRRNQVAHRGGSPIDLLGTAEMNELVGFVDALAQSLFMITTGRYIRGRYMEHHQLPSLNLLEGPYKDGLVIVVARPDYRLFVDQPVFAPAGNGVRWGRIVELHIDDVSIGSIETDSTAVSVGILLDFKCPSNVELYALQAEDDVIWPPLLREERGEVPISTDQPESALQMPTIA